ncbi:MAG: hypothetical protein VW496_05410 [Pelagibacteraceae bacterium]|jgi:hypothetical protein
MASNKNAYGLCDICGWRYPLKDLKFDTARNLVCPTDFDGAFDKINHPQNFTANLTENIVVRNPRPDPNIDRNLEWQNGSNIWNTTTQEWQSI